MTLRYLKALTITLLLSNSSISLADGIELASPQKNTFVNAKVIKKSNPKYPSVELNNANAGMVDITMMIDKNGKPFEPVVDASSRPSFEFNALRSIQNYLYEPATFNGTPIETVTKVRVIFLVARQDDKVDKKFHRNYKSALKELNKKSPDKLKIEKKIQSMENSAYLSPYSYRHLNTLKHSYAEKFSSKQAQIDALYQLLLFENKVRKDKNGLSDEQRINARRRLVLLLIQTSQYGAAISEYLTLKKIDPKADEIFKDSIKQINDIKNNNQTVVTKLQLNAQGYHSTALFKRSFGFDQGSDVKQLKLRCTKKFAALEYQLDSLYELPESWGECLLQIIGTPGSTVELYQR